eukprot:GEZU01011245.1.p2 GENE.GEZU01011245.1~~GEZU01011245.1.p2  ORF type:complete len:122 (-),score=13.35 GEZU01011245.1:320-685(-)
MRKRNFRFLRTVKIVASFLFIVPQYPMPQRAASVQVNNNNNKTAIKFTKPGSSSLIIGHDDDLRPVSTLSESGYEHIPSEIWTLILSFAATSSKAQLHHFSQVCLVLFVVASVQRTFEIIR